MGARTFRLRATVGTYVAAAGLVLTGAIGSAVAVERQEDTRRSTFESAAAAAGQGFTSAIASIERTVHALYLLGDRAEEPLTLAPLLSADRVAGISLATPRRGSAADPVVTIVAGRTERANDAALVASAARQSVSALELARDSGESQAGVPVDGIVVIAIPHYGGAAVVTTADRRLRLDHWVLAVVDLDAFADSFDSTEHIVQGIVVDGRAVQSGSAGADSAGAEQMATLLHTNWTLLLDQPVAGSSLAPWLLLLGGLFGGAVALLLGVLARKRLDVAAAGAAALERETRTVAAIGPLLQQSLDLAEVLPAVAVRLSDEFDLDRFAVELMTPGGDLLEVFALGGQPGTAVVDAPLGPARDTVPAGTDVGLAMLRGGRTIGRLRFAGRAPMSPSQLDALRAAADLIAVATYNVELFEREQSTVRRLQEVDRLKDAFLGTISHELRTPITAISGFIRLLRERWADLTEEQRIDFLERLDRNAGSLGLLVDELLDFARLERQALSVSLIPVDASQLVGNIVNQLVPLLGEHEVVCALTPGAFATADPRAVERVMANLLTNAAKFSPTSSRITVTVRAIGDRVVISVADLGPGIPPEDRLRVFTRFYRGESMAARSTRGAGIGLAVVRELVQQMGGSIAVEENEPNGTRMVVSLPGADLPAPFPRSAADAEARFQPVRSDG